MDEQAPETALVPARADLQVALRGAVSLWASATTSENERRADLLRDKQRIVLSFFRHTDKLPSEVEPADVQAWLRGLGGRGPRVREALVHYLAAAGRMHALRTDAPLWTRHDRAGISLNFKRGEPPKRPAPSRLLIASDYRARRATVWLC